MKRKGWIAACICHIYQTFLKDLIHYSLSPKKFFDILNIFYCNDTLLSDMKNYKKKVEKNLKKFFESSL